MNNCRTRKGVTLLAAAGPVLLACLLLLQPALAGGSPPPPSPRQVFWNLVFYLSVAALVACCVSAAYVLHVWRRNAEGIRAAQEKEKLIERDVRTGPGAPAAGSQPEFSALKTVDSETGKVTYEMYPVSHSRTGVGTFAYILAFLGVVALLPVYGLPVGLAVLVLAPLAAHAFRPHLERVVGFKLIALGIFAAGLGALGSLLSSLSYFRVGVPPPPGAQAGLAVPLYVPFVLLGVLIFSVVVHESAHGLTAYWCGDSTAKRLGRLTLNPIRHFDPFGSFVLPALLFLTTGFAFGYARPVPINAGRFGRRRRDSIFTAAAGAAANFMLASVSLTFLALTAFVIVYAWPGARVSGFSDFLRAPVIENAPVPYLWSGLAQVFKSLFVINFVLGVFNLIPIPPLDGSHVLENLLPSGIRLHFRLLRVFGFVPIAMLLIILVITGAFNHLMDLLIGISGLIRFVTHLN